jgi:hypothetical protein
MLRIHRDIYCENIADILPMTLLRIKTTDLSLRLQRDCVATATHKQNIMKIFA